MSTTTKIVVTRCDYFLVMKHKKAKSSILRFTLLFKFLQREMDRG